MATWPASSPSVPTIRRSARRRRWRCSRGPKGRGVRANARVLTAITLPFGAGRSRERPYGACIAASLVRWRATVRFNFDELRQIKSEGFLAIVPHPDSAAGLFLLNYTARAQYQVAWDRYPALLDCRGTIVDAAGEVIAKPFRKFFNAGERPETSLARLAALGVPEVTQKLDGSMC